MQTLVTGRADHEPIYTDRKSGAAGRLLLFFLLLFAIGPDAFAQRHHKPFDFYNSEKFWNRLRIDSSSGALPITATDTAIVVVSNRGRQPADLRFMTEQRRDTLSYFVVFSGKGVWQLRETNSLSEALRLLPENDKPWVVYTEGMGKLFTSDLERGMLLSGQYGVNVILLDYPSIRSDKGNLGNYRFAKKSAAAAYKDFVPVLDSIRILHQESPLLQGSLNLFFHSMGNKVVRELVLNHKLPVLNQGVWVDNLILNAPCVPQKKHKKWLDQIQFAKEIYVHYNPEDNTLKWARILSLHKQLGDRPRKPLSKKAVYVNFNEACGEGHSSFLNLPGRNPVSPRVISYYQRLFDGDTARVSDTALFEPSDYRGIGYDMLP